MSPAISHKATLGSITSVEVDRRKPRMSELIVLFNTDIKGKSFIDYVKITIKYGNRKILEEFVGTLLAQEKIPFSSAIINAEKLRKMVIPIKKELPIGSMATFSFREWGIEQTKGPYSLD